MLWKAIGHKDESGGGGQWIASQPIPETWHDNSKVIGSVKVSQMGELMDPNP